MESRTSRFIVSDPSPLTYEIEVGMLDKIKEVSIQDGLSKIGRIARMFRSMSWSERTTVKPISLLLLRSNVVHSVQSVEKAYVDPSKN